MVFGPIGDLFGDLFGSNPEPRAKMRRRTTFPPRPYGHGPPDPSAGQRGRDFNFPSGLPQFGSQEDPFADRVAPEVEPTGPRGQERLNQDMQRNPHKPGSAEYDRWVMALREDPEDPLYNVALRGIQGPAHRREQMRADRKTDPGFREGEPVTPEDFEARRRLQQQEQAGPSERIVLIGPDGEPLPDQNLAVIDGQRVPLQSDAAAGEGVGIVSGREAARSGRYVWMGDMEHELSGKGRFGGRTKVDEHFMDGEQAMILPYRWSPEQVAYAQEAMGLDATGFVDQQLISGWEQIVASAAGYAQAGRKMSPLMLLDMTFDATQAAKRGAGGGGGGGGAVASLSQTTGFLNAVMLEEVGREATNAEAEQFHAAFLGAGEVDPQQFATDWIRSVVGEEAGVFQAGTDYYTAMLQILGAQTQAEPGPQ